MPDVQSDHSALARCISDGGLDYKLLSEEFAIGPIGLARALIEYIASPFYRRDLPEVTSGMQLYWSHFARLLASYKMSALGIWKEINNGIEVTAISPDTAFDERRLAPALKVARRKKAPSVPYEFLFRDVLYFVHTVTDGKSAASVDGLSMRDVRQLLEFIHDSPRPARSSRSASMSRTTPRTPVGVSTCMFLVFAEDYSGRMWNPEKAVRFLWNASRDIEEFLAEYRSWFIEMCNECMSQEPQIMGTWGTLKAQPYSVDAANVLSRDYSPGDLYRGGDWSGSTSLINE